MTVVTDPTTYNFLPSGATVVNAAAQTTTTGTGQNTQITITSYGAVNQGGSIEDQNSGAPSDVTGYTITALPSTTPAIVVNTTGLPVADVNPMDVGAWVTFTINHADGSTQSGIDQILAIGNNGLVLSNNGGVLGTLVSGTQAIEGALPSNGQDIVLSTLNLDYFNPVTGAPTNPDANGNALAPVGPFTIGGSGAVAAPEPSMGLVIGFAMMAFVAARTFRRAF
jgi:hypothetical protein